MFYGISKNNIIAVGTHGCIKLKEDKEYFKIGLDNIVNKLAPNTIVVYGAAPDEIFLQYKNQGVKILQFDSATNQYHKTLEAVI